MLLNITVMSILPLFLLLLMLEQHIHNKSATGVHRKIYKMNINYTCIYKTIYIYRYIDHNNLNVPNNNNNNKIYIYI